MKKVASVRHQIALASPPHRARRSATEHDVRQRNAGLQPRGRTHRGSLRARSRNMSHGPAAAALGGPVRARFPFPAGIAGQVQLNGAQIATMFDNVDHTCVYATISARPSTPETRELGRSDGARLRVALPGDSRRGPRERQTVGRRTTTARLASDGFRLTLPTFRGLRRWSDPRASTEGKGRR